MRPYELNRLFLRHRGNNAQDTNLPSSNWTMLFCADFWKEYQHRMKITLETPDAFISLQDCTLSNGLVSMMMGCVYLSCVYPPIVCGWQGGDRGYSQSLAVSKYSWCHSPLFGT